MSDKLCRWLNEEVRLSKAADPGTFAKDFSNGYLIGEILHTYQMQDDFSMFFKRDNSIAKLNNFTRLEPTLKLLGIPFDINMAQDLMQEKQDVAKHLLHQLHVALEQKKKSNISRTMMEIMQPGARAKLHKKDHEIFSYRLPQVVKRDADVKFQKISQHYAEKCQQLNDRTLVTQSTQQKSQLKVLDKKRIETTVQVCHEQQNDVACKLATKVQVQKPFFNAAPLDRRRKQQHREQEAQKVQTELARFETNREKLFTSDFASSSSSSVQPLAADFPRGGSKLARKVSGSTTKPMLQSNREYVQGIRQRMRENAAACEQREKRLNRFLVEQFKAHEAHQEMQGDEQLVKRLTRQTKQEQRLAAQLMTIRRQKEVILENRLFRELQYRQRKEKDLQEALYREAVLAQHAQLVFEDEVRKELELCDRFAAERAQSRHKEHFASCKDILEQIVDLATMVGEYHLLTDKDQIPEKQMRQWKELLLRGLPLYKSLGSHQAGTEFSTSLDCTDLEKQEILNKMEYDDYANMTGEWAWAKETEEPKLLPTPNNILGHAIQRLREIVHPPIMESPSPLFPHCAIKACVLGKLCSGKTSCLAKISEALGICVISTDKLIEEALKAYKNADDTCQVTEQLGEKANKQLITSPTSSKCELNIHMESKELNTKIAAADEEMRKGNTFPNKLLVDIVVEAISQVPAHSGWILDGFPYDINLAHLLEEALGGSVDEGNEVESNRTSCSASYSPQTPPPPTPVLDLALLLNVPDECAVRRGYRHLDREAAATDKTLYRGQIPHRIVTFQDTCPALEQWFGEKQNILVSINADVDEVELYSRVESVLKQVMQEKQTALSDPAVEDVLLDETKVQDSSTRTTPVDQPPALIDQEVGPTDSLSSVKKEKVQRHSENLSPASASRRDSQGALENQPESTSSVQESSSQVYVDEPIPLEIAESLCSHWDTVCDSYVNNVKQVLQAVHSQHGAVNHQLFHIRERYKQFLGRPDLKQVLVSHWQKNFNSILDMKREEDIKSDLHVRLDELCERLTDIIDKRKEEDEQEMASLMCEDHAAILIHHHAMLMQVELDHFQETLYTLRVYYWSMQRQVPLKKFSNFFNLSLLETPGIKDQDERRRDSVDRSVRSQMSNKEDKKTDLSPDSKKVVSEMANQDEAENLSDAKLISDYEEAVKAISELVSAEIQQRETKEQEEKLQEKKGKQTKKASAKRSKKEKQPSKKQKAPADDPEKTQTQINKDETDNQEAGEKIYKEYAAALKHEEKAAMVRLELVKDHGLMMIHSLQSRTQRTFSNMERWLQARYLAEMESVDQLSEVGCHHIEAGAKLQYELVLDCSDLFLNGDCHFVASVAHAPSVEKPMQSTPTITQLESLQRWFYSTAPSGFLFSPELSDLFKDMVSVNTGRNILPEAWIETNEAQMLEIVSLLTNDYELIDWQQFLLNAALPWPLPSISQLLDVLQRYKVADAGDTDYINKDQYLQTELWFTGEIVQTEDPSEPVPYSRLANLHKFFFQLFADQSFSPPRLDYVSMLQYFAADPDPTQGFIRALSVLMGHHLGQSSTCHLVKSMPRLEEGTELTSLEVNGDSKGEESLCASSSFLREPGVSIPALLNVICHKVAKMKASGPSPPGCLSQEEHTENLIDVYKELGYNPEDCAPFSILSKHPYIQVLMENSTHCELLDIHSVLLAHQDEGEADSSTF